MKKIIIIGSFRNSVGIEKKLVDNYNVIIIDKIKKLIIVVVVFLKVLS